MVEDRFQERVGALDVLEHVEEDADVVRAGKTAPLFQNVVVEDPPCPDVTPPERGEVQIGAVEGLLRMVSELLTRDAGAAADVEHLEG